MVRLAYLGCILLLSLRIASAENLVIDPFTEAQDNDTSEPFNSGLGTALRTLTPSPSGSIEITDTGLVTAANSGAPFLSYYYFGSIVDLTGYGSLLLRGVTTSGSPDIFADLFDPSFLQSVPLTPSGPDYVVDLSAFTDIDLTQVAAISFRFADTGSPFTVTANSFEASPVPEPSTYMLLGLGAAIFLLKRRGFSPLRQG